MHFRVENLTFYTVWSLLAAGTAWLFWRGEAPPEVVRPVAVLSTKVGDVDYRAEDLLLWRAAHVEQGIASGDRIATGAEAGASLMLHDGRVLQLGPDSLIVVSLEGGRAKASDQGEERVVLTVGKGSISVSQAPPRPAPAGTRSRSVAKQGKKGEQQKAQDREDTDEDRSGDKDDRGLEIRFGTQAITLAKASDGARISATSTGAMRVEAPPAVLASAHTAERVLLAPTPKVVRSEQPSPPPPPAILVATTEAAPVLAPVPPPEAAPKGPPLSAVGFEPELIFRGEHNPKEIDLVAIGPAAGDMDKLTFNLAPKAAVKAPPEAWTPLLKVGSEVVSGEAGWRDQVFALSLRSLLPEKSIDAEGAVRSAEGASPHTMQLRVGSQRRSDTQTAASFSPAETTLKIRTLASYSGHAVHVVLDTASASAAHPPGWLAQDHGFSYAGETAAEIYLRDGRDLGFMKKELAEAARVRIEISDFGEVPKNEGAWLARGGQVVGWVRGTPLSNEAATHRLIHALNVDVAFTGSADDVVPDLATALADKDTVWVLNGAHGEPLYSVASPFVRRYANIRAYLASTHLMFFAAPVRILAASLAH